MTDQETLAGITARLEARLVARLVEQIRPLLAGRSPEVQRTVLAALEAEFAADKSTPWTVDELENTPCERVSVP
jgi:hypothetical protein